MRGRARAGAGDDIQRMQDGVREWVQQSARRGGGGLRTASPAILLSLLCAGAFCPLLMVGGVAGAGLAVLSTVGGGVLTQAVTDALDKLRQHGQTRTSSQDDMQNGIAEQIQRVLEAGDERADALRTEIASVLKEIDAGGTALRAALDVTSERVRSDVIAAIGVLGSDFSEMGFLIKDVVQAAAEIQKSLDVQGANVRAIIDQNDRQSTDIRLVREELAAIAERAGAHTPVGVGTGDRAARWVGRCPYRGLLPFGESDEEVFYGRERLVAELAGKLATRVTRGGLTVVTGASGAGKSSLLRAGLLPVLARGQQVPGSDTWPRIVMTPTKEPLTELAARLAALGDKDAVSIREGLVQHPGEAELAIWSAVLASAARQQAGQLAPSDATARLVLIVDQFEQVFTLGSGPGGEAAQQAFITALCAAATHPVGPGQEPPALVLIAVRGDFWDRCAAYPELAEALRDGQFLVGPMTESELRMAITGPADAAGLRIDPALTDTILGDLRTASGDRGVGLLPLLSQAMALTWEKREGDELTSRGYSESGGVSHAVQTGADRAYDALSPAQQALAREELRSMTVASRDDRLSRRPVTRADLYSGFPDAARPDIDAVLEAFAAERLVVLDGNSAQLSHDVLLRDWPRLRGWLEEDRASWILYGQLADDATAWHENHDDASFLYGGTHLTALQQAATQWSADPQRFPALTGVQRDFLHASERAATRRSRQRRGAVALLAALTLVACVALVVVAQLRNAEGRALDQAIYNQTAAEALQADTSDTPLAAQLSLAAYRMQPTTADAVSRVISTENIPLATALADSTTAVTAVALSPDGRTVAAGSHAGGVRLWDVAGPGGPRAISQPLKQPGPRLVTPTFYRLVFSPDGHLLAGISGDGALWLWDVADPAHPRLLSDSFTGGGYRSLAFSPDGHMLAIGNSPDIELFDVTDPAHPRQVGDAMTGTYYPVLSLAFSRAGNLLASGGYDGTVRLWNVADPAHPQALGQPQTGNPDPVEAVAFSPDSRTLATGSEQGAIRLWDVANPTHPQALGQPQTGNTDPVDALAFSPDSRTLATGGADGDVRLWDVGDPATPRALGQPLAGNAGTVFSLAFSQDGRTLASGNDNGTVLLWDLPRTVLVGPAGPVLSVAVSPDGRILAGDDNGQVWLWNIADPGQPRPLGQLPPSAGDVVSMAFSPKGLILATGNDKARLRLWNMADPARPRPLSQLIVADQTVYAVAFSPDGRTLAAGGDNDVVNMWNVADPARPRPSGQPVVPAGTVYAVAFSPDGRTLATGDAAGAVRLWNLANPAHPYVKEPLSGGDNAILSVAFDQANDTLASGNAAGQIQLWNVSHPAHPRSLGQPQAVGIGAVLSLAFSPDGHTLASGDADGTVGLWDVADPAHARPLGQPLTGHTNQVNSVAFGKDSHTLASASSDGTIMLWNLNVSYAITRICSTARNILTPQEWQQNIQQPPYQSPCAH
jgi:WD40 repeat protein